jgi:hypothetical protein
MKIIDEIEKIIRKDKNKKITEEVLRCVEEYKMDLADAKRLCWCWGLIDEEIRI